VSIETARQQKQAQPAAPAPESRAAPASALAPPSHSWSVARAAAKISGREIKNKLSVRLSEGGGRWEAGTELPRAREPCIEYGVCRVPQRFGLRAPRHRKGDSGSTLHGCCCTPCLFVKTSFLMGSD